MSEWGAGREPDPGSMPLPLPADDQPPPVARAEREGRVDLVGVAAVAVGLLGIVVFGILAALVTGILASIAGQRARESGRSLDTAYLAFGLAAVDGLVWLVLHLVFDIAIQFG